MMQIEEYIPAGYKHRISRWDLVDILHIPDREVRRGIMDAQNRGIGIYCCNGGYFQRQDESDDPYIAEYVAMERHRFTTQAKKLKALRKAWQGVDDDQVPGQMVWEFKMEGMK